MNAQVHGFISGILFGVMFGIVLTVLFKASVPLGIVYGAFASAGALVMIYTFCGKCLCRNKNCAHFLPGLIAGILPPRKQGTYTTVDYIGVIVPALLMIVLPQYWLWRSQPAFIAFWIIAVLAAADIKAIICPSCDNINCPLSPR